MIGFVVLLMAVPVAVIGIVLPVNEYSWMASEGTVPPDCDIATGILLSPAGITALGGLLGFAFLLLRGRSKLRVIGVALSTVMLLGIGVKLPQYIRESARASELCSK